MNLEDASLKDVKEKERYKAGWVLRKSKLVE